MVHYLVSKDAGDMGIAEGNTRMEQIPLLVMRIADVFKGLIGIKPPDRMFSYCIQFSSDYKNTVSEMLKDIEREGLPDGVNFYEVDGKRLFEMRGYSGGVCYAMCFYLVCK